MPGLEPPLRIAKPGAKDPLRKDFIKIDRLQRKFEEYITLMRSTVS